MKSLIVVLSTILSAIGFSTAAAGQQTSAQVESKSSISGQVSLHGAPIPGVQISVMKRGLHGYEPAVSAKTNTSGKYAIKNLSPGQYLVHVNTPEYLSVDETSEPFMFDVALDSGEHRANVNLPLIRGAVITGRVSDGNGQPVVGHQVIVMKLSTRGPTPFYGQGGMKTDKSGLFQVFGLAPGSYQLGVGEGSGSPFKRLDYGQGYYPLTYYPGVLDQGKAGVIEVKEGAVVSGADIVIGPLVKTYEASGRIVDDETSEPQAGINWGYDGNAVSTFGKQSDQDGGFRITGLIPGRYRVFAGCEGNYYQDQVDFEVTDHSLSGLEIRRRRGASISGKAVTEGIADPAQPTRLTQVALNAIVASDNVGSRIDPDGSFYFCGVRPGRVKIKAWGQNEELWLDRVELNGVDFLRDGIEVAAGHNVTGVRLVFRRANGVIRGQVTLLGRDLPPGVRLIVQARRLSGDGFFWKETDEQGRFSFTGLPPGEYEIQAGSGIVSRNRAEPLRLSPVRQTVNVTAGEESTVTLVLKTS